MGEDPIHRLTSTTSSIIINIIDHHVLFYAYLWRDILRQATRLEVRTVESEPSLAWHMAGAHPTIQVWCVGIGLMRERLITTIGEGVGGVKMIDFACLRFAHDAHLYRSCPGAHPTGRSLRSWALAVCLLLVEPASSDDYGTMTIDDHL